MLFRSCGRLARVSTPSSSRYDPKLFRDPITDPAQLAVPLHEDDDRRFLFIKALPADQTPTFYRNHVVDKLVRVCMQQGKKELARKNVMSALEIVKRRQYQAWMKTPADQKESTETSAFKIAEQAIKNCRPLMKLQGVTRGGTTYQVPFPIESEEAEFRAMKMMRDICRQKAKGGETTFRDALAQELLLAYQNDGATIQAKQELHKTCEANRAFAHYRMSTILTQLVEFEKQYSVQTAEVTSKIGQLQSIDSSQCVAAIHDVQKLLSDVGELLEQMELAVRDIPRESSDRNKYENRVRSYCNDKSRLDEELAKAVKRLRDAADRDELLALDASISMDQQEEQLIASTERLERTSRKLHDAYRIAIETEQIGAEVLGDLGAQRETLSRARSRMREADADLARSTRVLNQMIRRVIQNRLALFGTAAFLILSFFYIIYRNI